MNANNDITLADEQIEMASKWFVNYDPNYKNKNIYSDLSPNFSWYLNTNVKQYLFLRIIKHFKWINNDTFNQVIVIIK